MFVWLEFTRGLHCLRENWTRQVLQWHWRYWLNRPLLSSVSISKSIDLTSFSTCDSISFLSDYLCLSREKVVPDGVMFFPSDPFIFPEEESGQHSIPVFIVCFSLEFHIHYILNSHDLTSSCAYITDLWRIQFSLSRLLEKSNSREDYRKSRCFIRFPLRAGIYIEFSLRNYFLSLSKYIDACDIFLVMDITLSRTWFAYLWCWCWCCCSFCQFCL